MPSDWKGPFRRRLQRQASERGRRMARIRWERDRARRERLAALTPEQFPEEIVLRIIVIEREKTVRETVIFSWDSAREVLRKLKSLISFP